MTLALVPAPTPADAVLAQLDDLRVDLDSIMSIDEATGAATRAEAVRSWVRVAGIRGEAAFQAAELDVRAQRRCGQLLLEYIADAGTTTHYRKDEPRTQQRRALPNGTLRELGISGKQSSRWQLIARIPGEEFEERISACRQAAKPPAVEAFVRAAGRFSAPMRRRTTPTLTLLRRAYEAMREVRTFQTSTEASVARQIARMSASWVTQIDEAQRKRRPQPESAVRSTSCLLCRRAQPQDKPDRCLACGGGWFTC